MIFGSAEKTLRRALLLLLLLGMALPALAEQGYITDRLHVTLRRGPGNEYKILKSLPSATPVEIVEQGERYLKVRLKDGEEGYVLTQYVSAETPSVLVAERLRRERDTLRDRLKALEDKERALQADLIAAGGRFERSENELRKTTEQFRVLQAGAEHVTEIMAERDRLQQETRVLQARVTVLEKDNTRLLYTTIIRWFLAGAGVLWFGWLLGRRPPRRSRTF